MRIVEVELSFSSSYTTDADLVVDPRTLADRPPIDVAMEAAGFTRIQPDRPGIWGKRVAVDGAELVVPVDLIVPEALAGPGRRSACFVGHDKQAAGRAVGLEAAVVDRSPLDIRSLDPTDDRIISVHVAGPVALLLAKLHKIGERVANATARPDRVIAKDGTDAYRLMLHLRAAEAEIRLQSLGSDPIAGATTHRGVEYLKALFPAPNSAGTRLAVAGLEADVPQSRVETVCVEFTRTVVDTLGERF